MNGREKRFVIVFTILTFGRSMLMGDIGTGSLILDEELKLENGAKVKTGSIISSLVPPAKTYLTEEISGLAKSCKEFLRSP